MSKKIVHNGIKFDSQTELKRYIDLTLLQAADEISNLKVHTEYVLIPANEKFRGLKYTDDFSYYEKGVFVCEDVKGGKTLKDQKRIKKMAPYRLFKIKQKLMYHIHYIEVKEVWL